ncbi:MAG: 1,4-dihydroxy-6-naphthoate synthase [Deltaproteobacteria bacterium HGW-Deltaproteobacteria-4]|nr:MAG: 1,4-dihydroxy-6-naphthoate synthase [Deltaproteobacteria bacterium HGW-Deltaproteobacteria-4]
MNSSALRLGYSPCPNDTFIFYALTHGRIPLHGFSIREELADVETLNRRALARELDLTKISYHAFGHLRNEYALLRSGGALGRGCGPLVVARQATSLERLRGKLIAIPGELTTANLLLQLRGSGYERLQILPFDKIVAAVASGSVEAGLIIHESRFTFAEHGLVAVEDLGAWWEELTGLPIPLGGILARRSLGREIIEEVESAILASVRYAFDHPEETRPYIRSHAQELDDAVIQQHIDLYVNHFSLDLGEEGLAAVHELLHRAAAAGIIPPSSLPLGPL